VPGIGVAAEELVLVAERVIDLFVQAGAVGILVRIDAQVLVRPRGVEKRLVVAVVLAAEGIQGEELYRRGIEAVARNLIARELGPRVGSVRQQNERIGVVDSVGDDRAPGKAEVAASIAGLGTSAFWLFPDLSW